MAKQFTLGKNERLKSRKMIEQLFEQGNGFVMTPFRILYLLKPFPEPSLQCGVGVSTKNFKKAVDRNRIKRLTREAWRLQKNGLQETVIVKGYQLNLFLIYTGREIPTYAVVFQKLTGIIKKLETIITANK